MYTSEVWFTILMYLLIDYPAVSCFQEISYKVEQHKEIIDSNNKSYGEMKGRKDEMQNERR